MIVRESVDDERDDSVIVLDSNGDDADDAHCDVEQATGPLANDDERGSCSQRVLVVDDNDDDSAVVTVETTNVNDHSLLHDCNLLLAEMRSATSADAAVLLY